MSKVLVDREVVERGIERKALNLHNGKGAVNPEDRLYE